MLNKVQLLMKNKACKQTGLLEKEKSECPNEVKALKGRTLE